MINDVYYLTNNHDNYLITFYKKYKQSYLINVINSMVDEKKTTKEILEEIEYNFEVKDIYDISKIPVIYYMSEDEDGE